MRILLVEDDPALGSAVRDYLARDGHVLDWVERMAAARACLPGQYSAVVLDLGLPDGDGLALLPAIPAGAGSPRRADPDRARPPVGSRARPRRRRGRLSPQAVRAAGTRGAAAGRRAPARGPPCAADRARRAHDRPGRAQVSRDGHAVELTAHEYALVVAFAEHPSHVLSRQQLEDTIYALDRGAGSNVVEVYVSRLRRKFGRDAIRTVRGLGYQWGAVASGDAE